MEIVFGVDLNYLVKSYKLDLDNLFSYLLVCFEVDIYFASLAAFALSSS